jgi:hypothetical protein
MPSIVCIQKRTEGEEGLTFSRTKTGMRTKYDDKKNLRKILTKIRTSGNKNNNTNNNIKSNVKNCKKYNNAKNDYSKCLAY